MKRIYYIFTAGSLKRKNNTICFIPEKPVTDQEDDNLVEEILIHSGSDAEVKNSGQKYLPVNDIDSIVVLDEISFNKRFLEFLGTHFIPMHIFNYYGNYKGSFYPPPEIVSGSFLIKQVKFYTAFARRLYLANAFVEGASLNIIKNIKRYTKKNPQIEKIAIQIAELAASIPEAKNYQKLMNIEAQVHKLYYSTFNMIIESEIRFTRRQFNPPPDPMNAMISFCNALVYSTVASELYRTKLNPTISYLHEPGDRRNSLVFDIAEVFKPLLADRVMFAALNKKIIGPDDFEFQNGACLLGEQGRRKVVEIYDAKLNKTIVHRQLKREMSYRSLVRHECYKLISHIMKESLYKPFIIWW